MTLPHLLLTLILLLAPGLSTAQATHADLAYGPDPAQRLDVYVPERPRQAPVLVLVHGGGWRIGHKDSPGVVGAKWTYWRARGVILVSVGYRLLPTPPDGQAQDVARALAYVQAHAAQWGGDPRRVVLMGHSAGAHLVVLVAADPAYAERAGAAPWLGTVALDSAAYDVPRIMAGWHPHLYDNAFGSDPAYWRAMSPTLRLRRPTAPMLLVCSSRRRGSCLQARAFADRDRELGARAQVLPEDLGHMQINRELGEPGAYTSAVDAFLRTLGMP